ncbi:AAA family ATPase [Rhizobium binae]|uniref:AAA family ATPase n=1 Tax=Rhizobium binae TaxID=1138190 RepID=UPI001C837536|nr:AAA family ATPase [Rhizobium binae]MBX4967861.1 AAA family ATPase [Rhizobium binae]
MFYRSANPRISTLSGDCPLEISRRSIALIVKQMAAAGVAVSRVAGKGISMADNTEWEVRTIDPMEMDKAESDYGDDLLDGIDLDALETDAIVVKVTKALLTDRWSFSRNDIDRALSEMNITAADMRAELIQKIVGHQDNLALSEKSGAATTRYTTRAVLVEKVTDELTAERSTFSKHDINRTLLEMEITAAQTRAELTEEIVRQGDVISLLERSDAATRFTTRSVLAQERQLMDDADALSEKRQHHVGRNQCESLLQRHAFLNEEQGQAVTQLTGAEGFAVLKGEAGTGKTQVLAVVREAYENAGRRVLALSFTNDVVQDLRQKAGFAQANTVDSELARLENDASTWEDKPVVVVDEAAMLSTKKLAALLHEARKAGAKVIVAGDDHQLPSIERGGMFGSLADFHGAAELHEVFRVSDDAQKRAFNHMHKGEWEKALEIFDKLKFIHWDKNLERARRSLVETWATDNETAPEKTRMVFAYTNAEVDRLNMKLREVWRQQGRLREDHAFKTAAGRTISVAIGDRLQLTGTDKPRGLYKGRIGTVQSIDGTHLTVRQDDGRDITFDTAAFKGFSHGYAGTIHRGQGKTLDQTYLLHTDHWRANISYVALTRHRDRTGLFVASELEPGRERLCSLAENIGRIDDRRPASKFLVDIDRTLINGMASLKVRDGLPGQVAGQKRNVVHLEERNDPPARVFGLESSRLAADGPEERIKRLKTHHQASPEPDVAILEPTGAASHMGGDSHNENAIPTTPPNADLPARWANTSPRRNLDLRPLRGRILGR